MHHALPHLSRVFSISTGVSRSPVGSSKQLKLQTSAVAGSVLKRGGIILDYSDCFYTNDPPCSQTPRHKFNWTRQLDISSFIVTARVNKYLTAFLFRYLFIYPLRLNLFRFIFIHMQDPALITTLICEALHQPKDLPNLCCLRAIVFKKK